MTKWHPISELHKALFESGLVKTDKKEAARGWIRYRKQRGKLTIPVQPGDSIQARHLVTEEMIEEIIKAWLPGGKGYFHYKTE